MVNISKEHPRSLDQGSLAPPDSTDPSGPPAGSPGPPDPPKPQKSLGPPDSPGSSDLPDPVKGKVDKENKDGKFEKVTHSNTGCEG